MMLARLRGRATPSFAVMDLQGSPKDSIFIPEDPDINSHSRVNTSRHLLLVSIPIDFMPRDI
jgi:hypothetical protein